MPAEFENGFSVREKMWHGLGVVLPEYPERDEAFAMSGQDWTVEKAELFATGISTWPRKVENHFAGYRSDTGAILAVHQDSYEVLQNSEGWDLAEAIADQDQAIRYETAITLKGGTVCSVLLRDESFTIPGDSSPTTPYLLVSWAHDGSAALVATATNVRVVCWNTLNLALGSGHRRMAFRHTKNVRERIEMAVASVRGMRENTLAYKRLATVLAAKPVSADGVLDFTEAFIPMPEPGKGETKANVKASVQRNKFLGYLTGPAAVPDDLQFTGYGLLQAGVEYLDWSAKSRSDETRFSRVMMTGDTPKQKLLALVRTAVGA